MATEYLSHGHLQNGFNHNIKDKNRLWLMEKPKAEAKRKTTQHKLCLPEQENKSLRYLPV